MDRKPSKEEVEQIRREVDKLIAQGKVYRDSQGRIYPVETDKGRA